MFENRLKIIQGDLSLGDFAKRLDVPKTTLHQYLKGRAIPFEFAVLVCERFGYDLNWLATGTEVVAEQHHPYAPEPLPPDESDLLRRFRNLDDQNKKNLLHVLSGFEALSEGSAGKETAVSGSRKRSNG